MNAADAQKLARRFIELPQDKRRLFFWPAWPAKASILRSFP